MTKLDQRTVKFRGTLCRVEYGKYANNDRNAIALVCAEKTEDCEIGEPWATASVNLVNEHVGPDEVCIKNYSENTGMLDALKHVGIITVRREANTCPDAWVCTMTPQYAQDPPNLEGEDSKLPEAQ